MLRRGKGLGLLEQLEKDRLADILGVVGALEVGVAQAEDQVGIGVHQPFGLPRSSVTGMCLTSFAIESKRFHP